MTEKRFLEFCRKIGWASGQLEIMNGEPIKLLNPVKSMRFDVDWLDGADEIKFSLDNDNK